LLAADESAHRAFPWRSMRSLETNPRPLCRVQIAKPPHFVASAPSGQLDNHSWPVWRGCATFFYGSPQRPGIKSNEKPPHRRARHRVGRLGLSGRMPWRALVRASRSTAATAIQRCDPRSLPTTGYRSTRTRRSAAGLSKSAPRAGSQPHCSRLDAMVGALSEFGSGVGVQAFSLPNLTALLHRASDPLHGCRACCCERLPRWQRPQW
jgi:hypothetical protein